MDKAHKQVLKQIFTDVAVASALGTALCAFDAFMDTIHPPVPQDTKPVPQNTGRVSLNDFVKAHPEFAKVNFSAIGKLRRDGENTCTAVLLEPGNIVATARHCIDTKNLGTSYSFVTRDVQGRTRVIPLRAHGTRYFQYVHVPAPHDISPELKAADKHSSILGSKAGGLWADIAFFQLHKVPKGIEPAQIAPPQNATLQKVFAAGYSPHVRRPQGDNDSGLSVTKESCNQAYDPDSERIVYISTCYVDYGDSGGAHFVIDKGKIKVTGIQHGKNCQGVTGKTTNIHAVFQQEGLAPQKSGYICSAPLAQMGDFCRETMGRKYCTGFPVLKQ